MEPLKERTLYEAITADRPQTYKDGYGTTREMYEKPYIPIMRKVYHAASRFLNGPSEEEMRANGMEPAIGDLGSLGWISAPQKAIIMAFSPETKQWAEISSRAAKLQEGNTAKYSMYKAIGKNEKLPAKIASRKANLVEKGVTEYGEPYVIRKNELANKVDRNLVEMRKNGAFEKYSGPADWANSGTGSRVVKGHKYGGILKRK